MNICYGVTSADGRLHWGLGADGRRNCKDCCYRCQDARASRRLTCNSTEDPIQIPQARCTTNSNGTTTWTIFNDTAYTIRVRFTGPTNRTIDIASRQTTTINLNPGTYQETAEVLGATGVRSYAGQQTIGAGQGCTQTFVITTANTLQLR